MNLIKFRITSEHHIQTHNSSVTIKTTGWCRPWFNAERILKSFRQLIIYRLKRRSDEIFENL